MIAPSESVFLLQQPIRYAFASCTVRRCNGQKETRHEPASGVYFFFLLYHQPILLPSGSVRVRVEASSSSKKHLKKQKDTSEHWRGSEKRHKPARPTGKMHTARYCTLGEVRCSNLHRDAVQSPLVGSFSPQAALMGASRCNRSCANIDLSFSFFLLPVFFTPRLGIELHQYVCLVSNFGQVFFLSLAVMAG